MLIETLCVRDQLLAAVASAGAPLSTVQAVLLAPTRVERRPGCIPSWHQEGRRNGSIVAEQCHGTHHVVTRRRYHHEVYQQLRALEAQGLIQRVQVPGRRDVHWRSTAASVDVAELEVLWSLPARDPR